jgi:uncharacterized membrane protein
MTELPSPPNPRPYSRPDSRFEGAERQAARLRSLELAIARFLRFGALFSGCLLLLSWVLLMWRGGSPFAGLAAHQAVSLRAGLQSALRARDAGLLLGYAGLATLIGLPILRVALVAALFGRGRERGLALAAGAVLFALGLSFVLGFEA